ncbi:hypothetical protein IE81DRAFT_324975 [Ceraceosorus guamensis]|uniref:Uncharacterized protein n=1 Tax=Ceraceosorus guamensis TaxID=1522189 RepID=A0A316VVU0_9BASI|nr:hypothetical protein IE81DRAFT_324975 [Ceraceosorus guamensis]PWN41058.1 hypothetical protein IE81DRAFT_324975 [Ceraceosorus guamensis]
MLLPTITSAVCFALLSVALYHPYTQHLALHHTHHVAPSFPTNKPKCDLQPEPRHCIDVVVHQSSRLAYLICDADQGTGRWSPAESRWEHQEGGSVWYWDYTKSGAKPTRLHLHDDSRKDTGFHPVAIALADPHPADLANLHDPETTVLLVSNRDEKLENSGVGIYVHERASASLRLHSRIDAQHLASRSQGAAYSATPNRLLTAATQWSPALEPNVSQGADPAAGALRLPSFFFLPGKPAGVSSLQSSDLSSKPSFFKFAQSFFMDGPLNRGHSADIHFFAARTRTVDQVTSQPSAWHQGSAAPLLAGWDGGGESMARNSTNPHIYVASAGSGTSGVTEWEEHWVRGIEAGIRESADPYVPAADKEKKVNRYVPSYVTLFEHRPTLPPTALSADRLGRLYLGESLDPPVVLRRWTSWLRSSQRDALASAPPRPRGQVSQVTFIHRWSSLTAHPWDTGRLSDARKKGIFLPKKYFSLPLFASDNSEHQRAWSPTPPTGVAVDQDLAKVIITSTWDERGVAICDLPSWAEQKTRSGP